jgi:P-type E1-E2 ATPase
MLAGIQDLLRPDSKNSIKMCHDAGIIVVMVTGDNSVTARSIANDIGITHPDDYTANLCMDGK